MAQNPLLGKRISLISKKNIRYEGLLYSINEQNATVALQNVRSYGTEGRERELSTDDPNLAEKFVPPNDAIHPYLLFRGQDIKDLHVHENQSDTNVASSTTATGDSTVATAAATSATAAVTAAPLTTNSGTKEATAPPAAVTSAPKGTDSEVIRAAPRNTSTSATSANTSSTHPRLSSAPGSGRGGGRGAGRSTNNNNNNDLRARTNNTRVAPNNSNRNSAKEGTGASLLSRSERGMNVVNDPSSTTEDFDFEQAATAATIDNDTEDHDGSNNDGVDHPTENSKVAYSKDDFFDSISCDAIDKQSGVDRRLRGQQERKLNTETFGAVALNNNSNRYYNNRSRGGGSGNSGGRYNSGRSRGGRGRGYYSNSDIATEGNTNNNTSNTRGGGYRGSGRGSGGRSNYRGGRSTGPRGSNSSGSGRNSQQQQPASTTIAANAP